MNESSFPFMLVAKYFQSALLTITVLIFGGFATLVVHEARLYNNPIVNPFNLLLLILNSTILSIHIIEINIYSGPMTPLHWKFACHGDITRNNDSRVH
ncbi:hypothetical protein BCR33DRAFT_589586 [Rhizoclosmatium globosum]|uniref:Uncharacterized protein n=1 Tax=Rhizoclosmatium globosum TaxID=329046 RepID=A0A1Y2B2W4_9FUNG|nr:hypothetical protein BCR33DRAFT_589586 [Rhizoclosmatium globosum]|eukprot:ORY28900.1 hypothetical protein BCR33DRAFT_589586 [Rhizoclosmatium globosum]